MKISEACTKAKNTFSAQSTAKKFLTRTLKDTPENKKTSLRITTAACADCAIKAMKWPISAMHGAPCIKTAI
jgi:hypothetical protein